MATTITAPLIPYNGSKFRLAGWYCDLIRQVDFTTLASPFLGGGSVEYCLEPQPKYVIVNDIDSYVTDLFSVLQDREQARELYRLIKYTPYHEDWLPKFLPTAGGQLNRAYHFYLLCHLSRGANRLPSALNVIVYNPNGGNYPSRRFARLKTLTEIACRVKTWQILNRDALDFIDRIDAGNSREVLWFCDPPYLGETRLAVRAYTHDAPDEEFHRALADRLKRVKSGKVLVCGYDSDLYRELYEGWAVEKKETMDRAKNKRTECVFISPASRANKQQELFG